MLSICIPIYNTNCNKLVDDLIVQIEQQKIVIEIVCIDDKSTNEIRKQNENLTTKCDYILLDENIGRAKIRNKFLNYAKYDWLLFLDNDAIITNENYLKKYIETIINSDIQVVCGGTNFLQPNPHNTSNNLCYKVCNTTIQQTNIARQKNMYASFMTNNFCIKKEIFAKHQFNESLTQYGHEDTLLGFELQKNNVQINHINNNVSCIANDSNDIFLQKTEQAIQNLVLIKNSLADIKFTTHTKMLQLHTKLKSLNVLLKLVAVIFVKPIKILLLKGFANIKLYNTYKFLLLIKYDK